METLKSRWIRHKVITEACTQTEEFLREQRDSDNIPPCNRCENPRAKCGGTAANFDLGLRPAGQNR